MGGERGARRRRRVWIDQMAAGQPWVLDDAASAAPADARRMARLAWAKDRMEAWRRAHEAADAAWMALVAPFGDRGEDEDIPDLDPPPEQAVVEAILAEIHAVTEHDRWPRHLHWSL